MATPWLTAFQPHEWAAAIILAAITVVIVRKYKKNKTRDKGDRPMEETPGRKAPATRKRKPTEVSPREKERQQAEREKKKEDAKREGRRVFRISAPVVFILFSIAIGWENLVDFFDKSAGVQEDVSNIVVLMFSFGTIWAGVERYMSSRSGKTKSQFTILLWSLIALESTVQVSHGLFYSESVTVLGALFLACLSPAAGVVFEMAIKANRADLQAEEDDRDDREIPASYRNQLLLWLELEYTKATNPAWNLEQIVTHVRSRRVAQAVRVAVRRYRHGQPLMNKLAGGTRAKARLVQSLADLNPHGAPPGDRRLALAQQLNLDQAAQTIITAKGTPEAALKALELNSRSSVQADPPQGVQTDPPRGAARDPRTDRSNQEPETVQTGTREDPSGAFKSDAEDDLDRGLRELIEGAFNSGAPSSVQDTPTPPQGGVQEPFNTPEGGIQEPFNTPEGKSDLNGPPSVQSERPAPAPAPRRKAAPSKARTGRSKSVRKRKMNKKEQLNAVYSWIVDNRKGGKEDPSTSEVVDYLGVSQGTAHNRLKEAQSEADQHGHHRVS